MQVIKSADNRRTAGVTYDDAVRHFKSGILAHILNPVHKLPGKSFADQLRRHFGIQCHRHGAVGLHEPTVQIFMLHLDIFQRNPVRHSAQLTHERTIALQQSNFRTGHFPDFGGYNLNILAVLLSQRPEIRLRLLPYDIGLIMDKLDRLHVNLVHDHVLHRHDRLLLLIAGDRNNDFLERLTDLEIRFHAHGTGDADNPHGTIHPLLERRIDCRHLNIGKQCQMNRLHLLAPCCSIQIAEQFLGQKRRNRRHKLRQRHQALVQRLICSGLVFSFFTLPEAAAVAAHVPVGKLVERKIADGAGRFGDVIQIHLLLVRPD